MRRTTTAGRPVCLRHYHKEFLDSCRVRGEDLCDCTVLRTLCREAWLCATARRRQLAGWLPFPRAIGTLRTRTCHTITRTAPIGSLRSSARASAAQFRVQIPVTSLLDSSTLRALACAREDI